MQAGKALAQNWAFNITLCGLQNFRENKKREIKKDYRFFFPNCNVSDILYDIETEFLYKIYFKI